MRHYGRCSPLDAHADGQPLGRCDRWRVALVLTGLTGATASWRVALVVDGLATKKALGGDAVRFFSGYGDAH